MIRPLSRLPKDFQEKLDFLGIRTNPPKLGKGRWSLHSYVYEEMKDSYAYGFGSPISFELLINYLYDKNLSVGDINAFYGWDSYDKQIYFFPKTEQGALLLKMILGDIKFDTGYPLYYGHKNDILNRFGDLWN